MSEISVVEETVKRLSSHKGVFGVLIITCEGIPVRSTLDDPTLSVQYAALACQLTASARQAVRKLDQAAVPAETAAAAALRGMPGLTKASLGLPDDLQVIRMRSKKHEIIIAPEFSTGKEYTLVVIQSPVAD